MISRLFRNRKHPNVGKRIYSPYFDRVLIVTAYNSNRRWYFKFEGHRKNTEHRADTNYKFFKKHNLVIGEGDG